MLSILLTLFMGGVIGWLASLILNRDGGQNWILNIVVGIVGAFLGSLLLEPLFGISADLDTLSVPHLLVSLGGAVILLAIVNLVQHGEVRR